MRAWLPPTLLLALISLLVSLPLAKVAAATDTLGEQNTEQATILDRAHRGVSQRLVASSRWFDRFFGDPRSDEEPAGTLLRLRGSTIQTEGQGFRFDARLKAQVRLPRLKERFHLILASEETDLSDQPLKDPLINRELAETNKDTSLALHYTQERNREFSLTHRLSLDLEDGLNARLSSRGRYSLPIFSEALLNLSQVLFWERQQGFGEESRVDFNQPLLTASLLRLSARGFYAEQSLGLEWLTMVEGLRSFGQKRALSLGFFTAGETQPQNSLNEYNLFVKYRQQLNKDWLFGELRPEVYWLRENSFQTTLACTLTLEIQFGE